MKTKLCPRCGRKMDAALPPGGNGKRTWRCFDCDRPDPLTSETTQAWLKGELAATRKE
ncbi:hypothetical protein [Bradyrhizobium sp.]|uniref:hypothetical protein n=1 Tax=Bradyrhizobium sp. TaxID=376 RepID=UPI002615AF2A|nr:hypothetical protein [Bradyrhizobium sp.]